MSQVYITKASSNLIIRGLKKVQDNVSREVIISELEGDFTGFLRLDIEQQGGVGRYFNLRELRALYKMKMIFRDLPKLIETMGFNNGTIAQYIASENNRFAKNVKAPAYHGQEECEWLNAGFKNIELPRSVKEKDLRDKMKHFVNSHDGKDIDELNRLFKEEFQTEEVLRRIDLPNSGAESFDNMMISTKVEELFEEMQSLLYSNSGNTINKNVNNIVYADVWKKDNICKNGSRSEEDCEKMKKYLQAKKDLIDRLVDFYRTKYNNDLSFDGKILDSIGFRPCRSCAKQNAMPAAA